MCVSDFRLRIGVRGNVFLGTSWWLMARAKYISVGGFNYNGVVYW